MRVPFCLFATPVAKRFSRKLYFLTGPFTKINPRLDSQLEKAGFDLDARSYISISMLGAAFMSVLFFFVVYLLSIRMFFNGLVYGALTGVAMFFIIIFYNTRYPNLLLIKKSRNLEKNMVYAMKHILVQVKSGVPLFNAIVTVSEKDYGEMSVQMKRLVKEVETGTPLESVLDEMALDTNSEHFRRALWQLSNSLKSGVEISDTLVGIISNLVHDQRIAIRRYGAQLNPLTLVYMMIAVILPALGITLMIVMSSFSGTAVPKSMFYILLFGVAAFQFVFIGMIKSKRPTV